MRATHAEAVLWCARLRLRAGLAGAILVLALAPGLLVADETPEPGATLRDEDRDGVPDVRDQCARTIAGDRVDEAGCPSDPEPVGLERPKFGDPGTVAGVTFETNSANLTAAARATLDGVAAQLIGGAAVLEIGGHADSTGSEGYNQFLSEQRAQSVRQYLVGRGVAAERLTAVGYGESQPLDTNATVEGRQRNRRADVKLPG